MTDLSTASIGSIAASTPAPAPDLAPEPVIEQAQPSATEVMIEAWFADSFFGSLVSRDTAIFNIVRAAADDLKNRLKEA
jgi:hypothetical protein